MSWKGNQLGVAFTDGSVHVWDIKDAFSNITLLKSVVLPAGIPFFHSFSFLFILCEIDLFYYLIIVLVLNDV